jgi:hypothetical protein
MKSIYFISIMGFSLFGLKCTSNTHSPVQEARPEYLTVQETKKLDSVDIDYQLRGNCYAYSSKKNALPSNGEAHSHNLPKPVNGQFPDSGFYLKINEKQLVKIDSNYLGYKLYLINSSNNKVELEAQDSRLNIVAEAWNPTNKTWMPVTYLPSSKCGNSYHKVILDKDEYWEFEISVFKGSMKTRLRYVLLLENDKKVISNEIQAFLNPGQFNRESKQGHQPKNIMDPYHD